MSKIPGNETVNLTRRPIQLNCNTRFASGKTPALDNVQWDLGSLIGTQNTNYSLMVSLIDMVFFNVFKNITKHNNTLKVVTVFKVNGVVNTNVITVIVPPGYYQIQQLLDYLNGAGVCNSTQTFVNGITTYNAFLGLGGQLTPTVAGVVNPDPDFPGFYLDSFDFSKIHFQSCPGGDGGLGRFYPEFEYFQVGLVVDLDTAPFMSTLGLIDPGGTSGPNFTSIQGSSFMGASIPIYHGTQAGTSMYTYVQPISADIQSGTEADIEAYLSPIINVYRLGGPTGLSLSIKEFGGSNFLCSYQNFSSSGTIATIPIVGAYGNKNVWQTTFPVYTFINSASFNTLSATVVDTGTGIPVDFQGSNWEMNILIEFVEINNAPATNILGPQNIPNSSANLLPSPDTLRAQGEKIKKRKVTTTPPNDDE